MRAEQFAKRLKSQGGKNLIGAQKDRKRSKIKKRKMPNSNKEQTYCLPASIITQKQGRYIHSTPLNFIESYNALKDSFQFSDFKSNLLKEVISMNEEVLTLLKEKETNIQKILGKSGESIKKDLTDMLSSQQLTPLEMAREGLIQEGFSFSSDLKLSDAQIKKIQQLLKQYTTEYNKFVDTSELTGRYKNIYNNLIQMTGAIKQDNYFKGMQLTQMFGWLREPLVQNFVDKFFKSIDGKALTEVSGGSLKLQDLEVTLPARYQNLKLGINIKDNAEKYSNRGREINPKVFIEQGAHKKFDNWAHFMQYAYWNSLSLLTYHNMMSSAKSEDSALTAVQNVLNPIIKEFNTKLLQACYLIGLPSIFIQNTKSEDAGQIFSDDPQEIISSVKRILNQDNSVQNCLIVLKNKAYWTSEIYEKAFNQIKKGVAISHGQIFNERQGVNANTLDKIYQTKKEYLEAQAKGDKSFHSKTDSRIYFSLQSLINQKINTLLSGGQSWYFLNGRKDTNKIKLKYNIKI